MEKQDTEVDVSQSPPPPIRKTGLEAAKQLESSYASILESAATMKQEVAINKKSTNTTSASASSRIPRLPRQLSNSFKSFKGISLKSKSKSKSPRTRPPPLIAQDDDWSTGTSEFGQFQQTPPPTASPSPSLSKSVSLNASLSPDDMESAVISSIAAIDEEQKRIKSKKKVTAKIASNAKKYGKKLYQAGKEAKSSLTR